MIWCDFTQYLLPEPRLSESQNVNGLLSEMLGLRAGEKNAVVKVTIVPDETHSCNILVN